MSTNNSESKPSPTLIDLAKVYLRIGNLTFGGGAATVAALQREMVTARAWLSTEQFGLSYALSRVTPGTNLLAFCTATGWIVKGRGGATTALLAASIPSCAFVALVTGGFDVWSSRPWVQVAIAGALAASVGILLASFWLIVHPYLKKGRVAESLAIVAGSIFFSLYAGLSPITVLALAGLAGYLRKTESNP